MAKTAKNHNIKKNELVDIAEKLFLEKGYEETSIEDILHASGLSKGGFYHYFKSKEEVITESIGNLMENSLLALQPIIEDSERNAIEKLKLFMEKKTELQNPKKDYAKYLSMIMKSDFILYKYYTLLAQRYVEPLAKIIEQGAREGVFSVRYPSETADILLRAVTSLPQSIYSEEYLKDEIRHSSYSFSIREVIARVLGIDSREIWKGNEESLPENKIE